MYYLNLHISVLILDCSLMSQVRDSGVMLSGENSEAIEGGNSAIVGASNVLLSAPHVLAMSATPIPRTLALAMHGDMSISQVRRLAPCFLTSFKFYTHFIYLKKCSYGSSINSTKSISTTSNVLWISKLQLSVSEVGNQNLLSN